MNHHRGARILLSFDDPEHEICLFSFDGEAGNATIVSPAQMPPQIVNRSW